jgi:DNA-binding MarR family transcriptional regulator
MIIDNPYEPKLPRDMSFGWQIAVLGANMSDSLDKELKSIGLSINQWPTLFALWEEDGLTQTELTSRCNTAHYTTTRLLDSLEKMGLVERQPHPTSRRAHLVYLTKKGRNLEEEAVTKARAVNAKFLSSLSKKEQEQVASLILKMTTAPPV